MPEYTTPKAEGRREKEGEKRKADVLRIFSACDYFLQDLTQKEAKKQLSKIKFGKSIPIFGSLYAKIFEGVSLDDAEALVNMLKSMNSGPQSPEGLKAIVEKFPLGVVESYSDKLTDPKEAIKVLRGEYSDSALITRGEFYTKLRGMGFPPSLSEITKLLGSDISKSLGPGQDSLRLPALDFYLLLLQNYDRKRPSGVFGALGLSDNFALILQKFLEASHRAAVNSGSFDAFDAKMKELKLEVPVVKL